MSGTTSILHAAQEDYEVLFRLTGQLPGWCLIHKLPMRCLMQKSAESVLLRQNYWVRRFLNKKLAQVDASSVIRCAVSSTLRMTC